MASSTSGGGASGPETRLSAHQRGTRSGSPTVCTASTSCTATIKTENNNTLVNDIITLPAIR